MVKKIKILYVNHVSYIGGAERSLLSLLANIDRTKFEPLVVCPQGGDFNEQLHLLNVRTIPFRNRLHIIDRVIELGKRGLFGRLRERKEAVREIILGFWELLSILRKEKPDIVHANSWGAAQYLGFPAYLMGLPSVCHIRDVEPVGREAEIGKLALRLIGMFSRVVAISNTSREFLLSLGLSEKKIVTIYNGVDMMTFDPNISGLGFRKELGVNFHALLVGLFGFICERKGHRDFISAAQKIASRFPDAIFLVVGEDCERAGKNRDELQWLVRKKRLEEKVLLLGFRSNVVPIMAALDVIVSTSIAEAFGRVLIEAMAMEKPVIATEVGGQKEIVEPDVTGLLVPPRDPQALAEAIVRLLSDADLRERMGRAGRARVEKCFSISRHIENIQGLYEELAR